MGGRIRQTEITRAGVAQPVRLIVGPAQQKETWRGLQSQTAPWTTQELARGPDPRQRSGQEQELALAAEDYAVAAVRLSPALHSHCPP